MLSNQNEYMKGGDFIAESKFLTPGKWDNNRPPHIIAEEFYSKKLKQAQKVEILQYFDYMEAHKPKNDKKEPIVLIHGFIAMVNLIGSYSIIKNYKNSQIFKE